MTRSNIAVRTCAVIPPLPKRRVLSCLVATLALANTRAKEVQTITEQAGAVTTVTWWHGGGGNEALSLLTVKAWRHSSCHDHLPVPSVPWRSGRGAALSPEQVEDGVSQGIPSTCSATIWPLKQTSACKTIQLQVIKRINLVMLQSEGEHVIHYSSIRGLIRTWLIRVHHCLKLSTKKMF